MLYISALHLGLCGVNHGLKIWSCLYGLQCACSPVSNSYDEQLYQRKKGGKKESYKKM